MNNTRDIDVITLYNLPQNAQQLNEQYDYLYHKLMDEKRNISYLDLYNISSYINSPSEAQDIGTIFAKLSPNSAVGIGIPEVNFQGIVYKQGDLILKLNNGTAQKIQAPSHGVYVPYKAEDKVENEDDNTNLTFGWQYKSDIPTTNNTIALENSLENDAQLKYEYNLSTDNGEGYGWTIEQPEDQEDQKFWSANFNAHNNKNPIIKYFREDNNNWLEEIYLNEIELTPTKDDEEQITEWTINNIPKIIKYVVIR